MILSTFNFDLNLASGGTLARSSEMPIKVTTLPDVGDVVLNAPERRDGVLFLVNALVFNTAKHYRKDFIMLDPQGKREILGKVVYSHYLNTEGESIAF